MTVEQRVEHLERTVERLRREQRVWRTGAVLSGAFFLTLTPLYARTSVSGATGATVAAPFRVLDHNGHALLEVTEGRQRSLDERGGKLSLSSAEDEPHLRLFGPEGRAAVDLTSGSLPGFPHGGSVHLYDRRGGESSRMDEGALTQWTDGKEQARLTGGTLTLSDSKGHRGVMMYARPGGGDGALFIYNKAAEIVASLDVDDHGQGELVVSGKQGAASKEPLAWVQPQRLGIFNNNAQPLAMIESGSEGGRVSVFDLKGEPKISR